MSEFFRNNKRNLLLAGALAGSLITGACGSPEQSTKEEAAENRANSAEYQEMYEEKSLEALEYLKSFTIGEPALLPDGRRITMIPSIMYDENPIVQTEYCSATNLNTTTEQVVESYYGLGAGGGVAISPNHEWCEDGILTEADFTGKEQITTTTIG